MNRLPLLNTLLERERERRDAALLKWREAQRAAEAAREQSDALITYRGEYRKRWAAQFSQSAPIEIVRCYQGFVERLEQAISAQQGQSNLMQQREEQALQQLRHRETKLATVKRLIERRQQAWALLQAKREQKASDELAQRSRRPDALVAA